MTEASGDSAAEPEHRPAWCGWCGAALLQPEGAGRPRRWCKPSCRQQAHVARKLSEAAGFGDDQLVVSRSDYELLQGRLHALREAVADHDRVPPLEDDPVELKRSLDWILSHARSL